MKIIILPGYSVKNRDWAESIKNDLEKRIQDSVIEVVYWRHWSDGDSSGLRNEYLRVLQMIGDEQVVIIAKSIGTWVAMKVVGLAQQKIEKLILCGLPLSNTDTNDEQKIAYMKLSSMEAEKVLVFQNTDDPHGPYLEAKAFMEKIHPGIRVIEKPGDTHEYFYTENFVEFLTSTE